MSEFCEEICGICSKDINPNEDSEYVNHEIYHESCLEKAINIYNDVQDILLIMKGKER